MTLADWTPLAVAAITAVGLWIYNRKRPTVDLVTVASTMIDQLQEQVETAKEDIERLEGKDRVKRTEIDTLRTDVDALRRTEGRLIGWVARLHAGVSDGSVPPLPDVPTWLDELLTRTRPEEHP